MKTFVQCLAILSVMSCSRTQESSHTAATDVSPQGETFNCFSNIDSKPYFTFIVRKACRAENASISYVKSAFFSSEEVQVEREVPGCSAEEVGFTEITGKKLYVECTGDGDAGYLSADRQPNSDAYFGRLNFPESSNIEGIEDGATIPVSCHRVP